MILWRQGVFVGTSYWTLPPPFLSCAVWSAVGFSSCASARPHSNLLIILNRRFPLGSEGHDWNFWRHVWEDERRRAQTSHLNPKWGHCLSLVVLSRYITEVCFFLLHYQMSFEEDNYEPRSDGGDSCRSVPMAIRSEEITLHSSSLK